MESKSTDGKRVVEATSPGGHEAYHVGRIPFAFPLHLAYNDPGSVEAGVLREAEETTGMRR